MQGIEGAIHVMCIRYFAKAIMGLKIVCISFKLKAKLN